MATLLGTSYFNGKNGTQFQSELYFDYSQNVGAVQTTLTYYLYFVSINGYSGGGGGTVNAYINGNLVGSTTSIAAREHKYMGSFSQTVQHNADGTFPNTAFSSLIDTPWTLGDSSIGGTLTSGNIPSIAVIPSVSISGTGSSSSSRANLSSSGATLSFVLGSTGGRSTTIQYKNGSGTWVNLSTQSNNGTYSLTIPSSIISTFTNTATPNVQIRATNSGGTSGESTAYLSMDSSIKPSISSVTVTPSSNYSVLNNAGLYVQKLTKPNISIASSGSYSSTVNSWYIESMDCYNTTVTNYSLGSSSKTYGTAFEKSGTCTLKTYVKDTRGRQSASNTKTLTIIPYSNPAINSTKVERCNSDGTLNNDGTYCKLTINYTISPITSDGTNYNTKTIQYSLNNSTWINITTTNWNGSVSVVFNNNGSAFNTSNAYTIYTRIIDLTTTVQQNMTLQPSACQISYHNGGDGITFGQVATQAGYHFYNGDLYFNGTKIFYNG